jgi:hypothetical protein
MALDREEVRGSRSAEGRPEKTGRVVLGRYAGLGFRLGPRIAAIITVRMCQGQSRRSDSFAGALRNGPTRRCLRGFETPHRTA